MVFAIHDSAGANVITKRSLARLFRSFFCPAESQVDSFSAQLHDIMTALPASFFPAERYKVVRKAVVRKQLDDTDEDYDYGDIMALDKIKIAELEVGDRVKVCNARI